MGTIDKQEKSRQIRALLRDFEKGIEEALQVFTFNEHVYDIVSGLFESFANLAEKEKKYELAKRAKRLPEVMKDLSKHNELQAPIAALYAQGIVLAVGVLESYLKKVFSILIRENPERVIDKESKISFSTNLILEYGFNIAEYLDQILLDKGSISFQDLKSCMRSFENYTDLNINDILTTESKIKDNIILIQAIRHIVVHNSSMVDRKFISQIRETKYSRQYPFGGTIELESYLIMELINSVKVFGQEINKSCQS